MIRSLRVARASAIKARTQAINALKALVVTAPAELREQLRGLSTVRLVQTTAASSRARSPLRWPPPCWGWGPWPAATRPCRPSSPPLTPSWTG
jgi:hypothetical protein